MTQQVDYQYDVFISYSHVDQTWVQNELLPRLEAAALKVMIDYRDFAIGVPSLINMEQAVDKSRHTLIVLTPAWIQSQWTEFESLLVATADPAVRRRKLIPLLLKPCELPPRIGMLTYADLTGKTDSEMEFAKVIRSISDKDLALPSTPLPQEKPIRPQIALDLSHGQKQWKMVGYTLSVMIDRYREWGFVEIENLVNEWQEVANADVLIIALPRNATFTQDEINKVISWVESGKGLLLLGYYLADSHHEPKLEDEPRGLNINALARSFGCEFADNLIMPDGQTSRQDCYNQAFSGDPIYSVIVQPSNDGHPITKDVHAAAFLSACSLRVTCTLDFVLKLPPAAIRRPIADKQDLPGRIIHIIDWEPTSASTEDALLAAWRHGKGRIVAAGTWKLCTLDHKDNLILVKNIITWLSSDEKEVGCAKVIKTISGQDSLTLPKPPTQEKPMSGIPSAQYKELCEALFDCGPFGDDAQLRAVFAHEKLRPFRYSVPQASDPAARVDATIAFLLEKYRADTRENALILLLRILRDRLDPADACHARLARLAENLEPVLMTSSPDSPLPSPPLQLIDKIRTLIRNNQLEEALRELSGIAKYQNQAVMLERQLNRAHAGERIGTITRPEAEATYGKIAAAILDIIAA